MSIGAAFRIESGMNLLNLKKQELIERIRDLEKEIEKLTQKAHLSPLLDSIRTIVIVIDIDGRFKYTTPSVEWLLGYHEEDLEERKFFDFIHPEDLEKIDSVFRLLKQSSGSSLLLPEFRFIHKRGAWIYLEGDVTNRLHDNAIPGLIMNLDDVSQRKLFELDYARLLGAVRISSDGFFLSDNEGNIIFINDAAMQLLGASSKGEVIGKNIAVFVPGEDLKRLQGDVRTRGGQIRSAEHRFITIQGDAIPVETSIAVMNDTERRSIGFVFISRDISERKRVEAEIEKYRYHLEELVGARTAELNRSMDRLRSILEGVIQSMGYALESRDQYTAGHQRRVADLACAIAKEMGLPEQTVEGIRFAALLHDIGKIYVPSEILNKHGRLDEIEYMLIKKHPQVGYDILKSIDFPWPIAEIVYQHHEKLDGSGYPRGLKNGEILLEARIISVADVMEAMTVDRPYKIGLVIDAALEELINKRGILFDEHVVDACVRLFQEKQYRFF